MKRLLLPGVSRKEFGRIEFFNGLLYRGVVGFDDQEASAHFQPPLTSVRQPERDIGAEAVRVLTQQIEHPDQNVRQKILLEPTLLVRASSRAVS